MNSTFASEIIALLVGPKPTVLHAHASVLRPIEFFRVCIDGYFKEGETRCIELPEEDAQAMGILLQYLYSSPQSLPKEFYKVDNAGNTKPDDTYYASLVYLTANKYGYFPLVNAIMEACIDREKNFTVKVMYLEVLRNAGYESYPLYQFFLKKLCSDVKYHGWQNYMERRDPSFFEDLTTAPGSWLHLTKSLIVEDKNQPDTIMADSPRWQFLVDRTGYCLTKATRNNAVR